MIKKVFIIFTFVLISFNIVKVNATTITTGENEIQITEENRERTNEGKLILTIEVRDPEDYKRLENIKISIEDENETWHEEYISDKSGFIKIKNLQPGKYKIQIVETPEKYILDNTIYNVEIGNSDSIYYGKLIEIRHKVGKLSIKCNVPGAMFEVITENCLGMYTADNNGEVYLENQIVGKCKVTPCPMDDYVIGEAVEGIITEGETCYISFIKEEDKKTEETTPGNNENNNLEKEDKKDTDQEYPDRIDNIHKIPEDVSKTENADKKENSEKKDEINDKKSEEVKNEEKENNSNDNKNKENKVARTNKRRKITRK